ncbi:MAG TPA: MFS transporter [Jatrophihabitans sp.]|uniref:MFS transporter n=1 Tax=Jatrophihabitans sp. TaxID=1932789 RepID=UPI002F135DD4
MKAYVAVLRIADYRLLWTALVINLLGDGATYTALAWITVERAGAGGLGVLGVCLTLPVIAGGAVIGPLLDRFSRRKLFIYDSVFRAAVVALIPLLAALDMLAMWHLYGVALVYGLLKIIPLAGTPAVLPELVPAEDLQAASGLEATAMGVANVVGPALGAVLITLIGSSNVLLLDALTYLAFAFLISRIKAPLDRPARVEDGSRKRKSGWAPVFDMIVHDKFLLSLTLSFAAFNISVGALLVALPWLAKFEFASGPGILGLLLAVLAAAELVGSLVSGGMKTTEKQMLRIGQLQIIAGGLLLLMVYRSLPVILIALLLTGILSAPMTVMGGVVRMTRTPQEMRGRAMTLMRTTMAGALPFGAAIGGILLSGDHYTELIVLVTILAAAPGVFTVLIFRSVPFRLGVSADADRAPAAVES